MSTSEEVPLQPVNGKDARDGNLDVQTESMEQDDTTDGQEVVASPKVAATPVTISQWKKVFITVMTLFTYTSLYAAISMIGPFYPIEVSILKVAFSHITIGKCRTLWGEREQVMHYSIDCYVAS